MDEKDFDLQNENLASSDEHDEKNVQPAEQIQEADAKGADEKVTFEENDNWKFDGEAQTLNRRRHLPKQRVLRVTKFTSLLFLLF